MPFGECSELKESSVRDKAEKEESWLRALSNAFPASTLPPSQQDQLLHSSGGSQPSCSPHPPVNTIQHRAQLAQQPTSGKPFGFALTNISWYRSWPAAGPSSGRGGDSLSLPFLPLPDHKRIWSAPLLSSGDLHQQDRHFSKLPLGENVSANMSCQVTCGMWPAFPALCPLHPPWLLTWGWCHGGGCQAIHVQSRHLLHLGCSKGCHGVQVAALRHRRHDRGLLLHQLEQREQGKNITQSPAGQPPALAKGWGTSEGVRHPSLLRCQLTTPEVPLGLGLPSRYRGRRQSAPLHLGFFMVPTPTNVFHCVEVSHELDWALWLPGTSLMRKAEKRLYTILSREVLWLKFLVSKLWESTGGCWLGKVSVEWRGEGIRSPEQQA